MSALEVLKKDIISYEEIRKSGKKCLTTNNEECCFVHYPEIKEALLALEQKDKKNFTKQELSIFLRLIKNEINNLGDIYSTTTKEQLKVFRKIRQEYTNIALKLIKELEEGVEK